MESNIDDLRNEVFRKIGRNLLNYQRLEKFIKFLVANAVLKETSSHSAEEKIRELNDKVVGQTMGQLKKQLSDNLWLRGDGLANISEDAGAGYVSYHFCVQADPAFYAAKDQTLSSIIAERNHLVHNFLETHKLKSVEDCLHALQQLDRQSANCLKESNFFLTLIKNRRDTAETIFRAFESEEFQAALSSLHHE